MRRTLAALSLSCSLALAALSGCIPQDAGYGDVRNLVGERTGQDVRWRHVDRDSKQRQRALSKLERPISVEDAVQIAFSNNDELQAVFEELGITRGRLVSATAIPNPVAEASVKFKGSDSPSWDLGVTQDLTELLFLPWRSSAARAELDAAKLSVAGRVLDLGHRVRVAYRRLQAAGQIRELRRTALLAARSSSDLSERLHEAGNITELDREVEAGAYEEARLLSAQAEADYEAELQHFAAVLGLWGQARPVRLAERLPDPQTEIGDIATLERRAVQQSIDLELLRRRFTAAAKRGNLASARGVIPELKAGVVAEREEGEWAVGPLVELEVPLFYQGQGAVAQARAEARAAERSHTATAVTLRATVRATALRHAAARARAEHFKKVLLPLRQRVLDQTLLQYNAMSVGAFQVLAAKRDQVETGRGYVEALRDYWVLDAELSQLVAGRLVQPSRTEASLAPAPRSEGAGPH